MKRYCIDLTNYERFPTREVEIGDIPMGSTHPIRLQSMINIPAMDTKNTVAQCMRIFDAGADYVRIATQTIKDAENLKNIRKKLHKAGYKNPLIADVHFNPKIAEIAAQIVEKVRINPGNYIDKRASFIKLDYTDAEYNEELEKIRARIEPLIKICKKNGTAIRIGSNHGSLSDRIMNRYGNTAEGMVEAAMEYISLFVDFNFKNLVISMKASNVRVMVQASRLLNARMLSNGLNFPQHLGVTEAGEGEDGRVRSALGIGSLLTDGIGDTFRVSLTENPEEEIYFSKKLLAPFIKRRKKIQTLPEPFPFYDSFDSNIKYPNNMFPGDKISVIGNQNKPLKYGLQNLKILLDNEDSKTIGVIPYKLWNKNNNHSEQIPIIDAEELYNDTLNTHLDKAIVRCNVNEISRVKKKLKHKIDQPAFLLSTNTDFPIGEARAMFKVIIDSLPDIPLILESNSNSTDKDQQIIDLCFYPGGIFIDGLANGIWINPKQELSNEIWEINKNVLQACGYRRSKAEFISCPSCGRTNFDIALSVRRVKHKLSHLKNLKIAVMGCVVNGPGEMVDADYGYVGAQKGKIQLYKGKKAVKKNIPEGEALNELIALIKSNNDWKDPE